MGDSLIKWKMVTMCVVYINKCLVLEKLTHLYLEYLVDNVNYAAAAYICKVVCIVLVALEVKRTSVIFA